MHGFTFNGKYMFVLFEMMHVYGKFLLFGCKCKWEGGGGLKVDGFYLVDCKDWRVGGWGARNTNGVRIVKSVQNIGRSLRKTALSMCQSARLKLWWLKIPGDIHDSSILLPSDVSYDDEDSSRVETPISEVSTPISEVSVGSEVKWRALLACIVLKKYRIP